MLTLRRLRALVLGLCLLPPGLSAGQVTAAVAANFLSTLETLEPMFEAETGHELLIAAGSTGSLYAQIANGAPYDVFLAADEARPARAIAEGLGVAGTDFVYAVGILVLYSSEPGRVPGPEALRGDFHHLAIANPRTAPYGAAAMQVLESLGLVETLRGRIAEAQSVSGAWAAVASGAADLGFVAMSSLQPMGMHAGSYWRVPPSFYPPLRQSAVLLRHGESNAAATDLLGFLRTDGARQVIVRHGYRVE